MQKQNTENAGGKRRKRERKFYSSEAGSAEKEKGDKKMKVVDRLWKHYVGESTRERRRRRKEEVLAEACRKYKARRQSKRQVHKSRQTEGEMRK